jgi:hypothetical protein
MFGLTGFYLVVRFNGVRINGVHCVCLLAIRDSMFPALRGRRKPLHLVFVKVANRAPLNIVTLLTFINPGVWSILYGKFTLYDITCYISGKRAREVH